MQIGRIDERGYLKGFGRRGYTPAKCLLELVANSLDAMDKVAPNGAYRKRLAFEMHADTIRMIDNGFGMNTDDAERMFALHNENHVSDTSRGVSGIGAKPSLSLLGGRQETLLYTRVQGGDHLCIMVPWNLIHSEGRWTGMVTTRHMTEDEKTVYSGERDCPHGTTIVFKHNETLQTILKETFTPIESSGMTNPLDRSEIIFGRDDVQITYKNLGEPTPLKLYNYFDRAHPHFYTECREDTIEQWHSKQDNRDRFLWRDGDDIHEISGTVKFAKDVKKSVVGTYGYHKVGEYKVVTGLRADPALFDPENPKDPSATAAAGGVGASAYTGPYNEEHLGKDSLPFLGSYKLRRNGQLIGLIEPPDMNMATSRGSWSSNFDTYIVQCEVWFNPLSSQDNHQDRVMNIQENKNQFDGNSLPKNFTRLVKWLKRKKVDEIQMYFTETLSAEKEVVPEPVSVAAPESESEPDSSSGEEDAGHFGQFVSSPAPAFIHTPAPAAAAAEPAPTPVRGITGKDLKADLAKLMAALDDAVVYDDPAFMALRTTLARFTTNSST